MGKDLKGKELGCGISQRKDGRFQARFTAKNSRRVEKNLQSLQKLGNGLLSSVIWIA